MMTFDFWPLTLPVCTCQTAVSGPLWEYLILKKRLVIKPTIMEWVHKVKNVLTNKLTTFRSKWYTDGFLAHYQVFTVCFKRAIMQSAIRLCSIASPAWPNFCLGIRKPVERHLRFSVRMFTSRVHTSCLEPSRSVIHAHALTPPSPSEIRYSLFLI